ncbi:peptidase S10, serine carboxypeptidase, alpha/beta hydrolase fold protein [Tanacetum coccineum]
MYDKKITQPLAPEKPTEAIPQPKQFPHSETHTGGSSSKQHTHQPTSPITHGFLTEKEYQQLLQDEEVLRQTLKEEARAEKVWEEKMKKEQTEYELFMLEFGLANIIYLDGPTLTGYSYTTTDEAAYSSDTLSASQTAEFVILHMSLHLNDTLSASQTAEFVRKFVKDHPRFLKNPFYVTGISYSGIVIPMITEEIYEGNEQGLKPIVNIKASGLSL